MAVESLLADLVAHNTISDRSVAPVVALLAERCEHLGMRVEKLASPEPGKWNLVCSAGPVGTDGIALSGHMDVVPVAGQPWTSDPFALTRRDDNLHGRGACDMKAFLAATVIALEMLPLKRLKKELLLLFTHDEEVGCLGSRHLATHFLAEGRDVPSLCLIGEPTDFQIFRMHPGHVAAR